jgi:hypothetical protein
MLKKLAVLLAAVAVSAPAFADRGNHRGHRVERVQHYHVQHRPVVVHRPVVGAAIVHHATTTSYGY